MSRWFVDTSLAVPLVLTSHSAHKASNDAVGDRRVELPEHASVETYSVLTRLPGDARLRPDDVATLIADRFGAIVPMPESMAKTIVAELAHHQIAGGAVYDALVALTAQLADGTLLTRDARAKTTYTRLGVATEMIS